MKQKKLNPVSSPERPLGRPMLWLRPQATGTQVAPRHCGPFPGVSDGIEQHRATRDKPWLARRVLDPQNLKRVEYGRSTSTGRRPEDNGHGMSAGIAKKSGNADGVKALTAFENKGETFAI